MVRGKSRKQWVSETFSLIVKSLSLFIVNLSKDLCLCLSLCQGFQLFALASQTFKQKSCSASLQVLNVTKHYLTGGEKERHSPLNLVTLGTSFVFNNHFPKSQIYPWTHCFLPHRERMEPIHISWVIHH